MSVRQPELLFDGRVIEARGNDPADGQTTLVLESVNDEGDVKVAEVTLPTAAYQAYTDTLTEIAADRAQAPD